MREITYEPWQMKDGFATLLVTTACSHRALLWWRQPILSICPILLTFNPVDQRITISLSLSPWNVTSNCPFFFIYVSDSFYYTQWTLWFQLSLFITISNYRYLRLIHWNRPGENSLSIDYNESETGELMALGYQSHLSTSCHVSVLCTIILDCGQIVCMKIICI